jgi:hypothetical protein
MSIRLTSQAHKAWILAVAAVTACGFIAQPNSNATEAPQPRGVFTKAAVAPEVITPAVVIATAPADSEALRIYKAAKRYPKAKIMVSTEQRWLWFVDGKDTLLSAPVAIGMGSTFEFNGKKYTFATPRGRRRVLKKEENPIWMVPEWHYYEKASQEGLEVVPMKPGQVYPLDDGTWLEIRDDQVGRVNQFGNFWPFTPGIEIIFDGKLFMPPEDSPQRRVPDALGPYKLDTGDGYLIHGTHVYNEDSIGQAVSHGCVRMRNEDVEKLYSMVEPGTPVFIF